MKTASSFSTASLYCATILTGGTSWYAAKLQLTDVSPMVSLIYRFGGASLVLIIISRLTHKKLRYTLCEHAIFAVLGALSFSLAFMLIYLAAGLITTGLIALAYSAVVLFNSINASIFLKEKLAWTIYAAAFFGIIGIILVFLPEILNKEWNWIGFGYAIAATVAFSFANIFAVYLQRKHIHVLPMTGISMSYGTLFLLITAFLTKQQFLLEPSVQYMGSLIYLILFPSVIGYTTYFAVLGRLGAERGSYTMLIVPIVALAISSVTEEYKPTFIAILGTLMVIAGNYWVITTKARS